ncbi:SGNH/GDSL hydrolase family protein [Nonomuraea jiangxiensis]|uniref:Lysophospholipase L1 n=1 Tax=Nonomuraea jiangxiensis TaxID=633440 RepID=A0A1G8I644_9ACTN|nr:SGNH/GDSL hydrolase family protein [Nonomuraea jiangxiensis]SDI14426.1 Lysophospholipase L1 [Nonomuraea jiangxiensis]
MTAPLRLAALGDSVTAGIGDPVPGRGWTGLLAGALGAYGRVELSNLATCGARSVDVAREQLPQALDLRPAVTTLLVGVNDTLRGRFDPPGIARDLEQVVTELGRAGSLVVTTTLPDPGLLLRVPDAFRRPLARRVRLINDIVTALAERHHTVHLDLAGNPALYDARLWSMDRLHPNERGHRMLARLAAARLDTHGLPGRLPDLEAVLPEPTPWKSIPLGIAAATGWLTRRCFDFLPTFAVLVAKELWRPRPDQRVDQEFAWRNPAGQPTVANGWDESPYEGRHSDRIVPATGERGHQLRLPRP